MTSSNPATVAARPVACSAVIPRSAPMKVAEKYVRRNVSVVATILHVRVLARLRIGVAWLMAFESDEEIC